MFKAHFSGRMVSGISEAVIASVYSEKTRSEEVMMMMKVMMMKIIIIVNKFQETTF